MTIDDAIWRTLTCIDAHPSRDPAALAMAAQRIAIVFHVILLAVICTHVHAFVRTFDHSALLCNAARAGSKASLSDSVRPVEAANEPLKRFKKLQVSRG
jgi:hypothetical protein